MSENEKENEIKKKIPTEDVTILFHADCADGFGAAYAAWKKFGDKAVYIAVNHGNPPPSEVSNRNVIICDFSYKKDVIKEIEQKAKSLLIFDHHKTAQEDLKDYPNAVFDMSRSGAGLTWDMLHIYSRPALINYIEDRDLWRWKYQDSREILASLDLLDKDFKAWDEFSNKLNSPEYIKLFDQGSAIVEYKKQSIKYIAKHARRMNVCGFDVPVVNSAIYQSEIGNYLSTDEPFALIWYQEETGRLLFSLRSKDTGIDVSEIAKKFGGGGHARASGFALPYEGKFPQFEKILKD